MRRNRLSLPRMKEQAKELQRDRGESPGTGSCDAEVKASRPRASPDERASSSRGRPSPSSPVIAFPSPTGRDTSTAPEHGNRTGAGATDKERRTQKLSPQGKQLPSSPWAYIKSSRKRRRPVPSSPQPPSSFQSSRQHRQQQQESMVIDLTEETCASQNQAASLHHKGKITGIKGMVQPTSPAKMTPAQATTASPRKSSAGFPTGSSDGAWVSEVKASPSPSRAPSPPQPLPPPQTATPCTMRRASGIAGSPSSSAVKEKGEEKEKPQPPARSTYLKHFEEAMETVMRTRSDYARLFTREECDVVQRFNQLSEPSKALYVRLFQRKGPWFRVDGMMVYDEVGSATPLWVRRRNAAAKANDAAAAAAGVISSELLDQLTVVLPPSTPFETAVTEKGMPSTRSVGLEDADEGVSNESIHEPGQNSVECALPTEPAAITTSSQGEAAAAVALSSAADSVAFTPLELTVLHAEIQSSLCELVEVGFLDALPDEVGRTGPGLEAALAAVECCMRMPELKALLKKMGGNKKPGVGRKATTLGGAVKLTSRNTVPITSSAETTAGGRRGILEELRRRLGGQQTLWGAKSPLVGEIERLISVSVESLGVDVDDSGRVRGNGASGNRGPRGKRSRSHWMVSVVGKHQVVFKRALRLMYLTCNTSALSSGRVGAASVLSGGTAGTLSSWSPGLSAAFGKTRYASYICDLQARAFQCREDFLRWEAAVELSCALGGAMEKVFRERPAAVQIESAEVAHGAEERGKQEWEGCKGGRDGVSTNAATPEVISLASNDELEHEKGALEVKQESSGRKQATRRRVAEDEQEKILCSVSELEEVIAPFFPEERRTGDILIPVSTAAAAASTNTSTAEALAIALVCSRCLRVHLGTPPIIVGSPFSSCSSVISVSAATTVVGGGEQKQEDGRSTKAVLRLLKDRCGLRDMVEIKPAGYMTPEEVKHEDEETRVEDMKQSEGDLSVVFECLSESQKNGRQKVAISSLQSVTLPSEMNVERSPTPGKVARSAVEDDGDRSDHPYDRRSDHVPEYLLQLDAGWVLASAVWEGVTLLEKMKDYGHAVELLIQLLATRYTPHRRGRWWTRLSIDLAHIKHLPCALWASREGLRDPQVRGGDRLTLDKRVSMLSARASSKKKGSMSSTGITLTPARAPPVCLGSCLPGDAAATSSTSPEQTAHRKGSIGYESEGHGGYDSDGRSMNGSDDEDDMFEDPAIERERRRMEKQRRKEQRRRQRKHRQKQPPARESNDSESAGSTGSGHSSRSSCLGASDHKIRLSNDVDKGQERIPAASMAFTGSRKRDAESSCAALLPMNSQDGCGKRERVSSKCGGSSQACGGDADGANAMQLTTKDVSISAAASTAAVQPLGCSEGLAGVSQVPYLLNNESIAGVVLAATTVSKEAESGGGVGVPEMVITGRRLNREVGVKSRFIGYGEGAACTVESLVLQHLSQTEEGSWAGWHCEGSPLRALWALLMWDVIFSPHPDVFQTPFQDAPLDLDFCPLFYLNRREAVDSRLAQIRAASVTELVTLVGDAWLTNENTVCRGLNWERSSVRHLQVVAAGLGGPAVAAILAALCLNHKHFAGGLPDLLLMRAVRMKCDATKVQQGEANPTSEKGDEGPRWRQAPMPAPATLDVDVEVSAPERFVSWLGMESGVALHAEEEDAAGETSSGGGGGKSALASNKTPPPPFKAVDVEGFRLETWLLEVKGPSDRLSDRQTAWLRILGRGGALVGVCHVAEGPGGSHAATTQTKNVKDEAS